MSAATVFATETIFVRLLNEGVDVWRPVLAVQVDDDTFRLISARDPDEDWEFETGASVRVAMHRSSDGTLIKAAASRV